MLRHELRQLAADGCHVLVSGRVKEIRRHGEHTDVMLKACTVRRVERRQPTELHPEVKTDHLWLRFKSESLEPLPAPAECPTDLRHLFSRPALQMLERVRLLGVAGFYTTTQGELGIGITEVVPAISETRLTGMAYAAQECFLSHPWRAECLATLEVVTGRILKTLRDDWVLLTKPTAEVETVLQRMLERCRRDHAAERRARDGGRQVVASLPGMNPLLDAIRNPQGRATGVEQLLANNALERRTRRRYGWLME